MTLFQSISIVFKRYAVFKGRACRSECWWWQLFVMVLVVASAILECLVIEHTYGIITSMVSLILFLPYMAVSVRRCHDSGHTGWWILCPVASIIMMFLPSEQADNDYGVIKGVVKENTTSEKVLTGCLISLLLPILLLVSGVVWLLATTFFMKISGVPVIHGYETIKQELMQNPGVKLYDEDTPIIPISSYDFNLSPCYGATIMLRSVDSLSYEGYESVVSHYAKKYREKPIIEGHDNFFNLYNKNQHLLSEINANPEFVYIVGDATDYGEGALFEIDKNNYIFVGYTSNWNTYHVHVLYYVL